MSKVRKHKSRRDEREVGRPCRAFARRVCLSSLPVLRCVSIFACVLVARLASDPEPPRYKAQVVKVAPDFLWTGAVSLARRWQKVAGDEDRETRTSCLVGKEAVVRCPRLPIAFLRFPSSLRYELVVAACKLCARLCDYDLELRNIISCLKSATSSS